jgi:hypothetical protein
MALTSSVAGARRRGRETTPREIAESEYAPGAPGPTVGVGPNGELVTRDEPGGWDKLLAAGTAAELTERVAFLDNIAIVADPATSDPAARAWMSPPALGPGPTLTMWT